MTSFGYTLMTEQSGRASRPAVDTRQDMLGEAGQVIGQLQDAGFTDIAIVRVDDERQDEFLATVAEPLLARLRRRLPR